ncbi:MAG: efflux RND transporter periplasmic adaptor subunit [Sporomusaceae bacterium]|nr:efflux RND transporter periplasmic adaptor subunit [Sporomusaceae bacterium]
MLEKLDSKKKVMIGVVASILVVGSVSYYFFFTKQQPAAAVDHSAHQAPGGGAVTGEMVKLDAKAQQLAGVQTAQVLRKALNKEIKTTGKVALNDSSRAYITSRVEGRVEELYVTSEGQYISPGQAIASVYSPTYIAAQEEYLITLESVQKLKGASKDVVQMNNRLLQASRRKLQLLNIPDDEIAHLEHTRKANNNMTIYAQFGGTVMERQLLPGAFIMPGDKLYTVSDLSTVWMYADLYEKDIAVVQVGQEVNVTSSAYPGENFTGLVTFINPVLDDATRTVKVRVEMSNPGGKLKPNLFVRVAVNVPLAETVVIPVSSLLDTGSRKVVFVTQDANTFVKRDIVIGQEADGYIQVLSGLQPGDTVVTAAAFLIDSQTQLGQYGSHAGHGSPKSSGAAPATTKPAASAPATSGSAPAVDHSGHTGR